MNIVDLAKQRLAICNECPRFWKEFKSCKECGCFMPAKALLPSMNCPLHKWEARNESL